MVKKSRESIIATQISRQFIDGMIDRMVVGYHSHGPVQDAFPHKVNAMESAALRIKEYEKTGNTEQLMDAANYLMIEFMLPAHPDAHFRPTDEDESPGFISNDFEVVKGQTKYLSDESWKELIKHRESLKQTK